MSFRLRIFLGYFILIGLAAYFFLNIFIKEVQPGVRQAMEETMVDSANLLADIAAPEIIDGRINNGSFKQALANFQERKSTARIWNNLKNKPDLRVYITNQQGIVIFDSENRDLGRDFSHWNDVYLTLRGKYGARSSKTNPGDLLSVSYVAAPVLNNGQIIGSLTVAKPNISVQPYIELARSKVEILSIMMLLIVLVLGVIFSWGFGLSVRRLVNYARAVGRGERAVLPKSTAPEFAELGEAMENMRLELEGKAYVEHYVETMTHEMKSPLAGIASAAELLGEDMEIGERQKFLGNIRAEAARLQDIIDRMLNLAVLEKRQGLEKVEHLNLVELAREVVKTRAARLHARQITVYDELGEMPPVAGDKFLLHQAICNLVDNAIDFTPQNGALWLKNTDHKFILEDSGVGIPDYAGQRIFERFYSLPRPETGKKSSGLGLNFVREIMSLHGGSVVLENRPGGGARAVLEFAKTGV